jgi:hypothetical protein
VADLHHEVRRDRRQQVVARLVGAEAQAGVHQVAECVWMMQPASALAA